MGGLGVTGLGASCLGDCCVGGCRGVDGGVTGGAGALSSPAGDETAC